MEEPREVLDFWFSEPVRPMWFGATPEFDHATRQRFEPLWLSARSEALIHWQASAEGCLALVIVLDQLPLNMYRGEAKSFATEAASRQVAELAINQGFDSSMSREWKIFLYLPYMHSEDIGDQDRSVELFAQAGLEDNLSWARHHRDIIRRFGRFPHRNAILGRASSVEERHWLESPKAFTG